MLKHIALGILLMVVTTVVHAGCTGLALHFLRETHAARWASRNALSATLVIAIVVVVLFGAALTEAAIWAVTYQWLGAIASFEEALYFSIVAYTTLGFGDIALEPPWRILSSFEAANGIILFGWSTALVYAFVQRAIQMRLSFHSSHRT